MQGFAFGVERVSGAALALPGSGTIRLSPTSPAIKNQGPDNRMARKRTGPPHAPPPERYHIEVIVDGETYSGTYWNDGPDVHARLDVDGSTDYAECRRDDPDYLARLMLERLVENYRIRKKEQ